MTPAEKQIVWNAIYKCTVNGYPGATYEEHDTPKDPRVRGGRWYWSYNERRELFDILVYYSDAGQTTAVWRELQKYKTKIPPACLRSIFKTLTNYIIAENSDILNTESGDRLITET